MRDLDTIGGDPRFLDAVWEIVQLHAKKQKDYGSEQDPFANVRASEDFGVPSWVGALVRLNDKVTRLKNFADKRVLQNESALDSMYDISVYALIAAILYKEETSDSTNETRDHEVLHAINARYRGATIGDFDC